MDAREEYLRTMQIHLPARALGIFIILSLVLLFGVSCAYRVERFVGAVKDEQSGDILEAVRHADLARISSLLDSSPHLVNLKDSAGYSPLHWACVDGDQEVIKLLLQKGAEVNAQSNEGYTPLHNAARRGNRLIVALLISNGASVNARSRNGTTPLKIAADAGYGEAASLLRHYGGQI